MSQAVVLFCKADRRESGEEDIEIFDGIVEWHIEFPHAIHRAEKNSCGWTCYGRRTFFIPRKDGVFSEIVVFVSSNYDVQDHQIIDMIVETLDSEVD